MKINLLLILVFLTGCQTVTDGSVESLKVLQNMHPATQIAGIIALLIIIVLFISMISIILTGKRPW